ncbi:MAG TPA: zf-HC2 domain-containing protein, partial [Kofleriaceae bacterium]
MTQAPECAELERTHALADGELTGEAAAAARDHLATCASCQAELADVLQLDAAIADRRPAAVVISLAWYRRRKLQVAAVALAAAAAVAVYFALPHSGVPAVAVALAPRRMTEARLAWPGAAGYRVYDVPRAGDVPHES